MSKLRVVHYINQFFANIGGEEKADYKPELREGNVGPGLAFQQSFGEEAGAHFTSRDIIYLMTDLLLYWPSAGAEFYHKTQKTAAASGEIAAVLSFMLSSTFCKP